MNVKAGQIVGSFVLRDKLADGGMGCVWAADHVTMARDAAVKLLLKDPLHDAELVRRFALEASTVARIHCPHVPEVLEHGVMPDGTPYIVMDLIRGMDLERWTAERGRLSLTGVVRLVRHLATALKAAHDCGVVHRDVKPSNILLSGGRDDFHTYLIDFGIAKVTRASTSAALSHPGTAIGTPSYMSPEQLMGMKDIDGRSDIWSLAVVVYYCLTGALPFEGASFRELCLAIYRGDYVPASKLNPQLTRAIDEWFGCALCGDRVGRFASAELMLRALESAVAGIGDSPHTRRRNIAEDPTTVPRTTRGSLLNGTWVDRMSRRYADSRSATFSCAMGGLFLGAAIGHVIVDPPWDKREAGQWSSPPTLSLSTTSSLEVPGLQQAGRLNPYYLSQADASDDAKATLDGGSDGAVARPSL